jgi:stage V sporulation protein B
MFQLVMSVNIFASTVALSGIRFAASRLIAVEIGKNSPRRGEGSPPACYLEGYAWPCPHDTVFRRGLFRKDVKGQAETVALFRILALSLPFFSLSAVLSVF